MNKRLCGELQLKKSTDPLYGYLWAKTNPYKSLLPHMIDAGCCAKAYLSAPSSRAVLGFLAGEWNCTPEEAIEFASYLVAMHDIGKATPQFQIQDEKQWNRLKGTDVQEILPAIRPEPIRHEFLSRKAAKRIWKKDNRSARLVDAYSCILALHHQRLDHARTKKTEEPEGWTAIQDDIEDTLRKTFAFSGELPTPNEIDPVCILLTGVLILSDWIASSGPFDAIDEQSGNYYKCSMEIAEKSMINTGMISEHRIHGIDSFQSMWPEIKTPRDIQVKCEGLDAEAPLTIIEAPMGEGKTEAALYIAGREAQARDKRGIYVALPTQATSNQMYGRFASMLNTIDAGHARLLHGAAFLMDTDRDIHSEDAAEAGKWLGTSRMGLLDENGVGTVDQAMSGVLRARFGILRLLGLMNKVLIIDELHAYDAYMSEIIESLLLWCKSLRIPVVLLSATLQESQRIKYLSCYTCDLSKDDLSAKYPLITQVNEKGEVVQRPAQATITTQYRFLPQRMDASEQQIAEFAVEQVKDGGCLCVLVNTVKKAQSVYRVLMGTAEADTEIMLFHARFTLGQREEIEKDCLAKFGRGGKRPKKAILVATQVVEQSLDIDFDGMITELAPIDLLLQRAGRVHRHRERSRPGNFKKPIIHVIVPGNGAPADPEKRFGSSGYVYAPFLLMNTESLLDTEITIQVPQDVRSVIAKVYDRITDDNMEMWQSRAFDQELMKAKATSIAFPEPSADYFFPTQAYPEMEDLNIDDGFEPALRATTRLGEPTFRIAFVPDDLYKAAEEGCLPREQQKAILLHSVSLRLTQSIQAALDENHIIRIERGVLRGCYLTKDYDRIPLKEKAIVYSPIIGVYMEGSE